MSDIYKIKPADFPLNLKEITDPPKILYAKGKIPDPEKFVYLNVVGSRHYSDYGQEVCEHLIGGLTGLSVVIVSGLALGIDTIAHQSALASNLPTVAVPGSGLDPKIIYPRTNRKLAETIVEKGGALLSEYEPEMIAAPWTFPKRNRIMAGLCQATLIVEAREKSGTLITARLAMEYNRDVLVVPGSIFNKNSFGPHILIRDGAIPITNISDLKEVLGFTEDEISDGQEFENIADLDLSEIEAKICELIARSPVDKDDLTEKLKLSATEVSIALSNLELKNLISEIDNEITLKPGFAKK